MGNANIIGTVDLRQDSCYIVINSFGGEDCEHLHKDLKQALNESLIVEVPWYPTDESDCADKIKEAIVGPLVEINGDYVKCVVCITKQHDDCLFSFEIHFAGCIEDGPEAPPELTLLDRVERLEKAVFGSGKVIGFDPSRGATAQFRRLLSQADSPLAD